MADNRKKSKNPIKTLGRTLGFVIRSYPVHCTVVLVCLVITTVVTANGTLFAKQLIDNYIQPMLDGTLEQDAGFAELGWRILGIALMYAAGVFSTYLSNRLMV
ncbi:MAG: ABC transporter ATP-binding protein, partial [Clostridia bacterium]|nr:ABC transporter ATP-binding protein [Clostridia bacterium]